MASTFWAGPRRRNDPVEITLSVSLADPDARDRRSVFEYEVVTGFSAKYAAATFEDEPQIKRETLSQVICGRRVRLVERKGHSLTARDETGHPTDVAIDLLASETMLGRLEDPSRYPVLDLVRRTLLGWRFYHDLRTDTEAPLRRPCAALATPNLASDGSNLAAVFATLAHIREDTADLNAAIEAAFPGARLVIPKPGRTANFGMIFQEFPLRTFELSELSDGSLKFLALAGALLAYRLPPFVALNEPAPEPDGTPGETGSEGFTANPNLAGHPLRSPRGRRGRQWRGPRAHGQATRWSDLDRWADPLWRIH